MNFKGKTFVGIVSLLISATAMDAHAAFDAKDREALRMAATELQLKFKDAKALDGKAVTVLPVKGDEEGYFERLLVGALVGAGKTCVISNDEQKDARFKMILKEIKWDERQKTLKSVDPKTIDELGKLKSTQIFVECRVGVAVDAKGKDRVVEADLMAYAIETKQYVWTTLVNIGTGKAAGTADESTATVAGNNAVRVRVIASNKSNAGVLTEAVYTSVCNELAKIGYIVNGKAKPDVLVQMACAKEVFDATGEWIRYKGAVLASTELCGDKARHLSKKTVFETGVRGLGEIDAERNLAAKITEKMPEWAKTSLGLADFGIRVVTVTLKTGKVASSEDLKTQNEFFRAAKASCGVRSVELVSQDSNTGVFAFRVVFDADKFGDGFLNEMVAAHPDWELSLSK